MRDVVIDVAGADSGGAARFRSELRAYLEERPTSGVRVIGQDRHLSPGWLVRRELDAVRSSRRIAANNISFVAPGSPITVHLRNPLHFLDEGEEATIPGVPPDLARQKAVVWRSVRRARRIVVPSPGMRRRVLRSLPTLEGVIHARFHPLTIPDLSGVRVAPELRGRSYALLTGLPSVHKDLVTPAKRMVRILEESGSDTVLAMTCSAAELGWDHERLVFLGRLGLMDVLAHAKHAAFSFLPTKVESFGYPLAEARSLGVPIVVPRQLDTAEVAGDAAVLYDDQDDDSLAAAVTDAMSRTLAPDPSPFDRGRYFDWLTAG